MTKLKELIGRLLCAIAPAPSGRFVVSARRVQLSRGEQLSVAPGALGRELPELPQAVAHVHSNGDVCMDRPVESNGVWPVELVTLKQAHDYAKAYAAAHGVAIPLENTTK